MFHFNVLFAMSGPDGSPDPLSTAAGFGIVAVGGTMLLFVVLLVVFVLGSRGD